MRICGPGWSCSPSPFLYPACFHAQQAAEKYLNALLTWHQIEFPKTHSSLDLEFT
ncbi:MAG TPA: HEPN domain-containing protein [bacterium]|nr:HEPN domain-containing protein [bacterium]HQL63781.1 HEPN domain-containing protein [bacterium]